MASNRKAQKETNKAIGHLISFVEENEPWSSNFRDLELQMVSPIANQFGLSVEEVLDRLFDGPFEEPAFGYLFEEMVACNWNNDGSAIGDYLKKRGWREGPHGKRYLRTLAETDVNLWITTEVNPGHWVEVRRAGSQGKPKRVYERSATQNMGVGGYLAARVLKIDKEHCFSGAILSLPESAAMQLMEAVDAVDDEMKALYQEMLDDKEIEHICETELAEDIKNSKIETLTTTAYALWAELVLTHNPDERLQIRNTSDEEIVLTKHRMKITGERGDIQKKLDAHFEKTQPDEWVWLNEHQKLIATLRIKSKHIEIETNSVERGKRGIKRMQDILGDAVGTPIGVHESLEQAMANHPGDETNTTPLSQEDLQNHPEVAAQMQQYLQNHYRESLDQPIPMLNDLTPRECAANPETREKAVHWLKNMELHNLKSGQVFDTTWMWEALNLTDYR